MTTAEKKETRPLLLVGASVRAAAFSALRAGLAPWCIDLFGDADLRARCPTMQLPGEYPEGFSPWIAGELPGPWMYTGALEGWPWLIGKMARSRPLWGSDEAALLLARHPGHVARILEAAGLPALRVHWGLEKEVSLPGRWMLKPLRSAGGAGVRLLTPGQDLSSLPLAQMYLQEYRAGEPMAAVYVGEAGGARFLGLTRQLIGLDWARSSGFRYCGSIGPIEPAEKLRRQLERVGEVLTRECGLRGLFGVDGIVRVDGFWPVEVNPRYTASVEVLEYATGLQALSWHRRVFDRQAPEAVPGSPGDVVGKVILFAREALVFPGDGPWRECLAGTVPVEVMPLYADLPAPGTRVEAGKPVLTLLARASSADGCLDALQQRVAEAEHWLFARQG